MADRPTLDIAAPISVHTRQAADRIAAAVSAHGIARVRGVATEHALLRVASWLGTIEHHPDSGPTGITTLRPASAAVQPGRSGFTAHALPPHTDRASVAQPPMLLLLACQRPARRGGATVLVDGRAVHDDLCARHPDALPVLSSPGAGYFGGANGYSGPVFAAEHPRTRAIRWSTDQHSQLSPLARPWQSTLRQLIDEHTLTLPLGVGDGLVVHNHWWLHGRTSFRGDRVLWRVLANPYPHWHIPPGFSATTSAGLPGPRLPRGRQTRVAMTECRTQE